MAQLFVCLTSYHSFVLKFALGQSLPPYLNYITLVVFILYNILNHLCESTPQRT